MFDLPVQLSIRSPEVTLKGRNQGEFWLQLRENLETHLARRGISWPVTTARARLEIEAGLAPDEGQLDAARQTLAEVPGVDSFYVARKLERSRFLTKGTVDRALVEDVLVSMAEERFEAGQSFAVRVNRVDKRFPLTSTEMEIWLGNAIRDRSPWSQVRLDHPDRTFHVDVYNEGLFFYCERFKGPGGLPVGMSGQALCLLSGGIDSPVASFLLARRGAKVDWIHVSATHVQERDFEASVVGRLARRLSRYSLRSRLFVVPYTHFDLALGGRETGYEPVLFRRFLFRVAEATARRIGALALATGDSLAQVSSQTLENLIATTKVVETLVLRPLVGMDKQQIMDLARGIGTYEISIEPYKDCCALYARNAKTRTRNEALSALEDRLLPDMDAILRRTLEDVVWAEYECGELVSRHRTLEAVAVTPVS